MLTYSYSSSERISSSAMTNSSVVCSVLFTQSGTVEETRAGGFIYRGDAATFHEWEFRTTLRIGVKKDDAYVDAAAKIVDALRDDAFTVAQEVGCAEILKVGGITLLVEAMRKMVFPLSTYEAKELFKQFTKPSGLLSRQSGESMTQYTSRRSRCWALLQRLDPEVVLSEGHRADMLLDHAGLDKNERTMIQASIGNERSISKITQALILQHPRVHIREPRYKPTGKDKGSGRSSKGYNRSRKGKGKGYGFRRACSAVESYDKTMMKT